MLSLHPSLFDIPFWWPGPNVWTLVDGLIMVKSNCSTFWLFSLEFDYIILIKISIFHCLKCFFQCINGFSTQKYLRNLDCCSAPTPYPSKVSKFLAIFAKLLVFAFHQTIWPFSLFFLLWVSTYILVWHWNTRQIKSNNNTPTHQQFA